MSTQFNSEENQNKPLPDNTPKPVILKLKNIAYHCEVWFYKKGQPKEQWKFIPPEFLNTLMMNEDLFSPFYGVSLSIAKKMQEDPIDFSGDENDRIYIYFSRATLTEKKPNETEEPDVPYPLLDDHFVIFNMARSTDESVHNTAQTDVITLNLMPVTQYVLMTTYPQWTTGFDIKYKRPSGKKTGQCIKEILELCGQKIDSPLFDNGHAKINYTVPLRTSALEAIEEILQYHSSEVKCDQCVFKWNQFSKKFVLIPLSDLFNYNLIKDEIKSFITIPVRSTTNKGSQETHKVTSPMGENIVHSIETIGTEMPQNIWVSRRKSTFVMDFTEFDKEKHESFIKNEYKDFQYQEEQNTKQLIAPYQNKRPQMMLTPHWRKSEREALVSKQLAKKLLTSACFNIDIPGIGSDAQVGRRFSVKCTYGADNERLKELLGAYLITHVTHKIFPRNDHFISSISGRSVIQAQQDRFAFYVPEEEEKTLSDKVTETATNLAVGLQTNLNSAINSMIS